MTREDFVAKYMHQIMIDLDNRATVPGIQGVYRSDKALIIIQEHLDRITFAVDKVTEVREKPEMDEPYFSKPTGTIPGTDRAKYNYGPE